MTKQCPYCAEEIRAEAIKCKHCLSWLGPEPDPSPRPPSLDPDVGPGKDRPSELRRSRHDRMLNGICGGIGHFFGVDPTWIRISYAVLTVFTLGIPGVLLYAILALVIPEGDRDEERAS